MTLDKWLQGKCAKWVPLLFTACHRQMQYKEKMNASSFHSRMSLLIKGSCSLPIPTMIGLDHYNRSMMLWLLGKVRETEQKNCIPLMEFLTKSPHTSRGWRSSVYIFYRSHFSSIQIAFLVTYWYLRELYFSHSESQTSSLHIS